MMKAGVNRIPVNLSYHNVSSIDIQVVHNEPGKTTPAGGRFVALKLLSASGQPRSPNKVYSSTVATTDKQD